MWFMWLPFSIYSGWVTVASVANVSSYLVKINWEGFGISPTIWSIFMILIALLINVIVLYKRNMYAFVLVGIWALTAIGVANSNRENMISNLAYIAAILLIIITAIQFFRSRNLSKTLP